MIDSKKKLFRWGPIDSALLPLSYPMLASFDKMKKLFGICWPESLIVYDKDKAVWIIDNEKLGKICQEFTSKIILDDKHREIFYKLWDERVSGISKIQSKIKNLENLGKKELHDLWKRWSDAYLDFWSVGMTAELFNYTLEVKLKGSLEKYFKDERDLNEGFAALSTPTKTSFYRDEEIDLMSISLLESNKRENALDKHSREYFWIYNNYLEANILDKKYFAEQIRHIKPGDAKRFLTEVEGYKRRTKKDKSEYVSRLKLPQEEVKLVELLDESIIFQDVRKKYNLISAHYLEELLKDISKRTDISIRDLKWLLPDEIGEIIDGNNLDDLIERRKNITTILCSIGDNFEIGTQNTASKINQEFNKAEFVKSVNLQGTVACTGKSRYFRGIAKIVLSPREGKKLKKGEILVTTMTTPDYVVCMKRAGAIITDIGGVTCHAAVVSRELGIPCIVGTEHATKSVKDGDILELHNLRGTVKIVRVG
jgi:phosphohistidine swiveling domain-containing protein